MKYILILLLIPFLGTSQVTLESSIPEFPQDHMMRVEIVKDTIITQSGFAQEPETIEVKGQTYVALTKQEIPAMVVRYYFLTEEKKKVYTQELIVPKL